MITDIYLVECFIKTHIELSEFYEKLNENDN